MRADEQPSTVRVACSDMMVPLLLLICLLLLHVLDPLERRPWQALLP